VVYYWTIGLAFHCYGIAGFVPDAYTHANHWGTGIAGGELGVGVVWIWYGWRGIVSQAVGKFAYSRLTSQRGIIHNDHVYLFPSVLFVYLCAIFFCGF
jgi:hypothetical protein